MGIFKKRPIPNKEQQKVIDQIDIEFSNILSELELFLKSDLKKYLSKIELIASNSTDTWKGYEKLDEICSKCDRELKKLYILRAKCDHLMGYTGSIRFANFWDLAQDLAVRVDDLKNYIEKKFLVPSISPFAPATIKDKSGMEPVYYCYFVLDGKYKFFDKLDSEYFALDKKVKNLRNLSDIS
jgi:hypothetical protein